MRNSGTSTESTRARPWSWGADLQPDGAASFRLWAPAHRRLWLQPSDGDALEMERGPDGWFEVETRNMRPGDGYMFGFEDGMAIPDPASRQQAGDVHGPSRLADPVRYQWKTVEWRGRPWHETIIYELHLGTFSPEGTFDGLRQRLDHLRDLGVTAVELMPVAQFAGARGWGYDGVLPYAPHAAYGSPDALKALVDAAHERELMVFLDVVYNHFGPEGSYLHLLSPRFFHPERLTPWGAAIGYDEAPVRAFLVENALYWLEEFRFDGLRFDAVDQIEDPSADHILDEIARTVRSRITDRHVHLATEDDRNDVRHLERDAKGKPKLFTAEWNDDFHHVAHVIATSDVEGYYQDYAGDSVERLARALAEGFIYQGEPSTYRDGAKRGVPSAHLTSLAFINFLQNHDQVGNRAFGERLTDLAPPKVVDTLLAILLLSPSVPLLFMGEEWGETRPFAFFCDFHGELADAVREGRRNEFKRWPKFSDPKHRALIPDPNALSTFEASRLDWSKAGAQDHAARAAHVRQLIDLRRREVAPRLQGIGGGCAHRWVSGTAFAVSWTLGDGSALVLEANVGNDPYPSPSPEEAVADWGIFATAGTLDDGPLPGWSCRFRVREGAGT